MAKKKVSKIKKMKSYESFDAWLEDQTDEKQALIKPLRRLVPQISPKLEEIVKWGNGCWALNGLPIIYIYAGYPGYVQFGLFAGAMVKDPKERLQGEGKHVRAIPIYDKKDIDKAYFTKLVKQAMKIKYK
ncbi:DUF1801 domain-containing protein [Bdellovibrio sp. HCB337]|uniref:DUF1801 domain-containing protein n=1 Tax=Bdellovibrio sp. HCB337 TaxID=3394358 RepID=UPI0039A6EE95